MLLGRWIGRSLRGDLEIVFLLYWVMRILFAESVADDEQKRGRVECYITI